MRNRSFHAGWSCLLSLGLVAQLAACDDEDTAVVDNPPAWIPAEPQPPFPPHPPVSPDPGPAADPGPWALDMAHGAALFAEKCQHCHGPSGVGGYGPALTNTVTCPPCREFTGLWRRIDEFMPFRNPESCDATCSRNIAAWISNGFSTAPSCTVDFRYDSLGAQQFSASVRIHNFRGLAVPSWRLGFTAPAGHAVTAAGNALVTQTGGEVLITPLLVAPGIADGAILEFGLQGTHGGVAILPDNLRLEASPCFTAPPDQQHDHSRHQPPEG